MKKVLVAVDNPNDSKAILSLLCESICIPDEVVLIHVEQLEGNALMTAMLSDSELSTLKEMVKDTEHKETLDKNAEKVLSYCKNRLLHSGFPNVRTVLREGDPSEEILKVADEEGVKLIIVGCSEKSRAQRYLTGCASREVEKNAKVPVMIAKGNGCGKHEDVWNGRKAYAL